MALIDQIINFAKICFINNLSHPALGHDHCFSYFFLGPSQQAQADDGAVGVTMANLRLLIFSQKTINLFNQFQIFDYTGDNTMMI